MRETQNSAAEFPRWSRLSVVKLLTRRQAGIEDRSVLSKVWNEATSEQSKENEAKRTVERVKQHGCIRLSISVGWLLPALN